MDLQKIATATSAGTLYFAGTIFGAGLCASASKVDALHVLKESLSVAFLGSVSTTVGMISYDENKHTSMELIDRVCAVFFITILASPVLSNYIFNVNINYWQATAFTLTGLSASLGMFLGGLLVKEVVFPSDV